MENNHKSVEYSKNQIIKAGKVVANSTDYSEDEYRKSIAVIDNWRAAHAYPLQVFYMHLKRIAPTAIVAQRLKRLASIVAKLQKQHDMSLWRMQDLGGCRVVVESIDEVYRIVNKYKASKVRHTLKKENDYIENPKESGYRCYHLVYEFHSDIKDEYNRNILIELQIRTKLQHLWATAVETMGLFRKEKLKSGQGKDDILRFFKLVSSLFALMEGTPIVPNTPLNKNDIIKEIRRIEKENNILAYLSGISIATLTMDRIHTQNSKSSYYILILNYETRQLRCRSFSSSEIDEATKIYNQIEHTKESDKVDVVLVSTSSFDTLRYAYPNYFTDIKEFIDILIKILK